MKRLFFFSALLLFQLHFAAWAQERKLVTGTIKNMDGEPLSDINLFGYNTIAEGEDAFKRFKETKGMFDPGYSMTLDVDASGYFEVSIPVNGALLFCSETNAHLERINYATTELNVKMNVAKALPPSYKTLEKEIIVPPPPPPEVYGPFVRFPLKLFFPEQYVRTNARLIVQSYLVNNSVKNETIKTDTLDIVAPVVRDGKQYHTTQLRRMNYDSKIDPLLQFSSPLDTNFVEWTDTISRDYTYAKNYLRWNLWIEDYNKVLYTYSDERRVDRIPQTLEFLEYTTESYELDPEEYRKHPRREMRDNSASMSLSFLVGKAQLDPTDTASVASLEKIKDELDGVVKGEGSTLREFHIMGVASPDGPYAKNVDLANKRMNYALEQITSVLPKYVRDRVYMTKKAEVAPWTAVADLLEADSLKTEAEAVRKVAKKYPENMDRQWAEIRSLPYYKSVISPRLPKLRSVKYEYKNEIYRELTPQEILYRYRNDEDYRSGKKEFALYEYWHLFKLLTDEDELEDIYKRAYVASKKAEGRYWPLPANHLALLYIKKGIVDTTILAPLIDMKFRHCNQPITNMQGKFDYYLNPEQIVANQVVMFLKAKKFARAYSLATILPNFESYNLLRAVSWVLSGYSLQKGDGKKYYDLLINNSLSQRNKVVMNIRAGNVYRAKTLLEEQQDDPEDKYLLVEVLCNGKDLIDKGEDYLRALKALTDCFKADPKYIELADKDYLIGEAFYAAAVEAYEDPSIIEVEELLSGAR